MADPVRPHQRPITRKPVQAQSRITVSDLNISTEMTQQSRAAQVETEVLWSKDATKRLSQPFLNNEDSLLAPEKAALRHFQPSVRASRRWQLRRWALEILWCVFSCMLFGAIGILFRLRDNKPLPKWPMGLTLNTVTALLATFCRVASVIPISEGISQLKWNWMTGGRPLRDIDVFNQASRGPWGSLRMVRSTRGQTYSVVAVVILVSGLVTSTFTQSAIAFDERLVHADKTATAFTAETTWSKHFPPTVNGNLAFDTNLQSAILQAIFAPTHKKWSPESAPTCSTANCTWPLLTSLGVCATMRNVTDHLEKTLDDQGASGSIWNISLSDVISFSVGDKHPGMLINDLPFVISTSKDQRFLGFDTESDADIMATTMSDVFFVHRTPTDAEFGGDSYDPYYYSDYKFQATEMLLHFCVKTFNISVSRGRSQTVLVDEITKVVNKKPAGGGWEPQYKNFTLTDQHGSLEFPLTAPDIYKDIGFGANSNDAEAGDLTALAIQRRLFDQKRGETLTEVDVWENIKNIGKGISDSITVVMRDYGEVQEGDAWVNELYISIRYEWLAFIVVQVVLTMLFLAIVISQTAYLGVKVVKSSEIATLFAIPRGPRMTETDATGDITNIECAGLQRKVDHRLIGTLRERDDAWVVDISEAGRVEER